MDGGLDLLGFGYGQIEGCDYESSHEPIFFYAFCIMTNSMTSVLDI